MAVCLILEHMEDVKSMERSNEAIKQSLDDIASQLGEAETPIIRELVKIRAADPANTERRSGPEERLAQSLAEVLWSSNWQPVLNGQLLASSPWINKALLESFSFTDMNTRNAMVPQAYENTFKWVFTQGAGACGFPHWLGTDNSDVFWITGKPGSGKTTLMKYIASCNQQLKRHLEGWAGGLPLVRATYYFWDAGTCPLQKSREGMIRTLLYRCLTQRPDLLPLVAPRRYAMYSLLNYTPLTPPPWEWEELSETLSRLAAESGKSLRLVLFIDGLDIDPRSSRAW